jgi:hypothetical protein
MRDMGRVSRLLECFRDAMQVLGQAQDLTPANQNVNRALGAFVRAVLDYPEDSIAEIQSILAHNDVKNLRVPLLRKLAEAEFQMELFYAQPGRVASFPYHENYRVLVAEEVAAVNLDHVGHPDDADSVSGEIYFIGSGPLPLTAIECARQTGRHVTCVERDPAAVVLSRRVIAEMGVENLVAVIEGDGSVLNYAGAGLVMVAALVDGKEKTIANIRDTAPGAMIGIRSAEGIRTLLYEEINHDDVTRHGYRLCGQSRTTDEVVNTTLFFDPIAKPVCGANKPGLAP